MSLSIPRIFNLEPLLRCIPLGIFLPAWTLWLQSFRGTSNIASQLSVKRKFTCHKLYMWRSILAGKHNIIVLGYFLHQKVQPAGIPHYCFDSQFGLESLEMFQQFKPKFPLKVYATKCWLTTLVLKVPVIKLHIYFNDTCMYWHDW